MQMIQILIRTSQKKVWTLVNRVFFSILLLETQNRICHNHYAPLAGAERMSEQVSEASERVSEHVSKRLSEWVSEVSERVCEVSGQMSKWASEQVSESARQWMRWVRQVREWASEQVSKCASEASEVIEASEAFRVSEGVSRCVIEAIKWARKASERVRWKSEVSVMIF